MEQTAESSQPTNQAAEATPGPPPGPLAQTPPRRWQVVLACAGVAGLYLAGTTARWEPSPDSALYLCLGRSLARGQGYLFNSEPNNTVTPGLPWVLAGVQRTFGEGMFAPNLLIVLCALGGLAMIYRTISLLSDRRTALGVAVATAMSYPFFFNSHRVLTDLPFLLLFWSMFYCCLRFRRGNAAWLLPAALLSIAGIVVRAPGGLLIAPLAMGLLLDKGPAGRRWVAGTAIFLAAAGTGLYFYWLARQVSHATPAYVAGSVGNFWASNRIGQLATGFADLPDAVAEMFTSQGGKTMIPLGILILAMAAIGLWRLWKRGQRTMTVILVCYPILLILLGGYQSIRPRYLILILPMLVYASIEGLCWGVQRFRRGQGQPQATTVLLAVNILIAVIVVANLPKVAYHAFYYQAISRKADYYQKIRHGQHADLMAVGELIRQKSNPQQAVAAEAGNLSMIHFVTDRRIEAFPVDDPQTADDAQKTAEFLRSRPEVKFVLLQPSEKNQAAPFWNALRQDLCGAGGMNLIYEGKTLQLAARP